MKVCIWESNKSVGYCSDTPLNCTKFSASISKLLFHYNLYNSSFQEQVSLLFGLVDNHFLAGKTNCSSGETEFDNFKLNISSYWRSKIFSKRWQFFFKKVDCCQPQLLRHEQ